MTKFNGMNDPRRMEGGCAEPVERLVRDNNPDYCNSGEKYHTPMQYRIADPKEMPKFLIANLAEEVSNLSQNIGGRNEWIIIDNLAEIKELTEALEAHLDFGERVANKKLQKLKEWGAYWRGVVWDGIAR